MGKPDETFIVRVRPRERDAILEQPSKSRRRRIADLSGVGEVIRLWLRESRGSIDADAASVDDRSQISEVGRECADRRESP